MDSLFHLKVDSVEFPKRNSLMEVMWNSNMDVHCGDIVVDIDSTFTGACLYFMTQAIIQNLLDHIIEVLDSISGW